MGFGSLQLQLGVDESYTLFLAKNDGQSIVGEATIEVSCGVGGYGLDLAIMLFEGLWMDRLDMLDGLVRFLCAENSVSRTIFRWELSILMLSPILVAVCKSII